MIIACVQIRTQIEFLQKLPVSGFHLPCADLSFAFGRHIAVNILAVYGRNPRCIFRLFHTTFDFKGRDPCLDQFGQDIQGTKILHGKRIGLSWHLFPRFLSFFCRLGSHCLSLLVQDPIGKPAGLGTAAPVATPASYETGKKALTGIAIAHGTVDKGLQLNSGFPSQSADLL